jgi:hypothetical protein
MINGTDPLEAAGPFLVGATTCPLISASWPNREPALDAAIVDTAHHTAHAVVSAARYQCGAYFWGKAFR